MISENDRETSSKFLAADDVSEGWDDSCATIPMIRVLSPSESAILLQVAGKK